MRIKFPYGSTAENDGLLLPAGQLAVDLEKKTLRLHDGVTPGGFELVGERAFIPEYITLNVAGNLGVQIPSGLVYAYSQNLTTWTEVTDIGSIQTIPANAGLLYVKLISAFNPNTAMSLGYGITVGDPLANNLLGVVEWWDHDINLRLGWRSTRNFTVPDHAPPNQTNMSGMFSSAQAFNQDLSGWDTSKVTNMNSMFQNTQAFNRDISTWDVSNVTTMNQMFYQTQAFNGDLSGWDVSNVTIMNGMFRDALTFNQDLSSWDVSKVTNMFAMFNNAQVFNGDLSGWNVSNVTNMSAMFFNAPVFNGDISQWDVSNVTNMATVFRDALAFNRDISGWDVSKVTTMNGMFNGASVFNQDLSGWYVPLIPAIPSIFDTDTPAWVKPNRQPQWGVSPP